MTTYNISKENLTFIFTFIKIYNKILLCYNIEKRKGGMTYVLNLFINIHIILIYIYINDTTQ